MILESLANATDKIDFCVIGHSGEKYGLCNIAQTVPILIVGALVIDVRQCHDPTCALWFSTTDRNGPLPSVVADGGTFTSMSSAWLR
jgi:hypothetical protein